MAGAQSQIIDIRGVPTAVHRIGNGPPVVVLHGGPGFDHRYLRAPLADLAARRTVLFYDQPGSGQITTSDTVSATQVFDHCAALVDAIGGEGHLGLVAHSFGCLVALGAHAAGMRRDVFDEGVLITPVPVDRARYDVASQSLFARIPPDIVARYAELAAVGASDEVVELMLPYYLAKPASPAAMDLGFNVGTFAAVTSSLGSFDAAAHLPLFRNCRVLTTGHDFTAPDLIDDVLSIAAGVDRIADAGHFPFHESPKAFAAILRRVFASP